MRNLIFVGAGIIVLGMGYYLAILTSKAFKPKIVVKTEKVTCPDAISLLSPNFEKMNNKKANFTYSPQLSGVTIELCGNDSLLIDKIAQEVAKRIELETKRKKR
jgi:hypothetical protein